ncbi:HalOD1 output domain-containing protein [Natrinema sp. 74]|uniref:HalOD1 output domain-containing protein n=1 Tax=Natrinema sp. 74 TaxID=3384159 RepID=UPI0038D3B354
MYKVELDKATNQSTSSLVIRGIAELTGQKPAELEPLGNSVDPEALDSFVAHTKEGTTSCRLTFQYHGYTVVIVGNRWLQIAPSEELLSVTT